MSRKSTGDGCLCPVEPRASDVKRHFFFKKKLSDEDKDTKNQIVQNMCSPIGKDLNMLGPPVKEAIWILFMNDCMWRG